MYKKSLAIHKHRIHGLQLMQTSDLLQIQPESQDSSLAATLENAIGTPVSSQVTDSKKSPKMPNPSPQNQHQTETPDGSESDTVRSLRSVRLSSMRKDSISSIQSLNSELEESQVTEKMSRKTNCESENNKKLTCEICSTSFQNGGLLSMHKKRVHGLSAHSKASSSTSSLDKNIPFINIKASAKTAESEIIDLQERNQSSLIKSIDAIIERELSKTELGNAEEDTKTSEEEYECEICFRVLRSWMKFKQHCEKMHEFTPKSSSNSNTNQEIIDVPSAESTPSKTIESEQISETSSHIKLECTICNRNIKNNFSLNFHYRKIHRKYNCVECSELFDSQDTLDTHIVVHEIENSLGEKSNVSQPSTVNKQQPSTDNASTSDNASSSVLSKIKCLYCRSTYNHLKSLLDHCRNAHNLYLCKTCHNGFQTAKEVDEHTKYYHVNKHSNINDPIINLDDCIQATTNIFCKICNLEYKFRSSLFKHIEKCHQLQTPCHICLDIFTAEQYKEHELTCLDPTLQCKPCGKTFTSRLGSLKHFSKCKANKKTSLEPKIAITSTPKKRTPACFYCKDEFVNYESLWSHVKHEHPSRPHYRCNKCQLVYFTNKGFNSHNCRKTSIAVEETEEDTPSASFESHENATESTQKESDEESVHQQSDDDEKPLCPACNKEFKSWPNVRRHCTDVHHNHGIESCMYCCKTFTDESLLSQHEALHVKSGTIQKVGNIPMKQKFTCRFCSKHFSDKQDFSKHLSEHKMQGQTKLAANNSQMSGPHSGDDSDENETYTNSPNAVKIKTEPSCSSVIPSNSKRIVCKYCEFELDNYIALQIHLHELHPDELYLCCESCDKIFFDMKSLARHKQVHTNIYTMCSYCSKSFARDGTRMIHEHKCDQQPKKSTQVNEKAVTSSSESVQHSNKESTPEKRGRSVSPASSRTSPRSDIIEVKEKSPAKAQQVFKSPPQPVKPNTGKNLGNLPCSICGEILKDAASLIEHIRQHAMKSMS